MTLASSIRRASHMIREIAAWLHTDIELGGFARPESTSAIDLKQAADTLTALASELRAKRMALLKQGFLVEKNDSGWSFEEMAEFERTHQEAAE